MMGGSAEGETTTGRRRSRISRMQGNRKALQRRGALAVRVACGVSGPQKATVAETEPMHREASDDRSRVGEWVSAAGQNE